MAPAAHSCHACGKSGCKLLRCGWCRNAWFCSRACQILAARQGHSGANCRPADRAQTHAAADDAAGPSTSEPGGASAPLTPNSCLACGKSPGKLLGCGRCRTVWFCNRECQLVAIKERGHSGTNCRPADGVQQASSATRPPARAPFVAPSAPMDMDKLKRSYVHLMDEAQKGRMTNTRVSLLTAAERYKEAGSVADLMGGAEGAFHRATGDMLLANCLDRLTDMAAAARAAVSALWAARASGNRTLLVKVLTVCGGVARQSPEEMAQAEKESREQERLSGSPSYGRLDLSQEGRISLPTTPSALSRMGLAYSEAAVAICDTALAAAGGRGSPAADDAWRVPSVHVEADARGSLAICLTEPGECHRRLRLMRQAVALLRRELRTAAPGSDTLGAKGLLATSLNNLGLVLNCGMENALASDDETAEAEACLREALELCEESTAVSLKQAVLVNLVNAATVTAEAEAFRSRLNTLYTEAGRSLDTNCTICLEPLGQSGGGARRDADGDRRCAGSPVLVFKCGHQFHRGCVTTWWDAQSGRVCPLCKK